MFSLDIVNTFGTAIFVFIVICYCWALLYSAKKIGSLYVGSLLKGILLVGIAICLLIISSSGIHPLPLGIMGMAIICLALMPK